MNSLASFSFLVVSILKLFLGSQLGSNQDIRFGSVQFGLVYIRSNKMTTCKKTGLHWLGLCTSTNISRTLHMQKPTSLPSLFFPKIYIYTVCVSFKNCFLKLFSFAQQKHFSLFSPKSQLTALRPFLEWNQHHWGVGLG